MSDIQTSISKAVAVLLARAGKSQAKLAAEMGMTPAWISNRMVGRVRWDTDDISVLATAFDMNEFELLSLAEAEARIPA